MCVCLGMALDWAFRAVCNVRRYRNGKWLHKKLI
jgi:Na+-driven multidrug efflux pump